MMDSQSHFTRTGAYNYLKILLDISKKETINKNFFNLFFEEAEEGFYSLKKPAKLIEDLFTEAGIRELNKMYYNKKIAKENDEAKKIATKVMSIVSQFLAA